MLTVQAKSTRDIHQQYLDSAFYSENESLLAERTVSISRSAICCLFPLIIEHWEDMRPFTAAALVQWVIFILIEL